MQDSVQSLQDHKHFLDGRVSTPGQRNKTLSQFVPIEGDVRMKRCSWDGPGSPWAPKRSRAAIRADVASSLTKCEMGLRNSDTSTEKSQGYRYTKMESWLFTLTEASPITARLMWYFVVHCGGAVWS